MAQTTRKKEQLTGRKSLRQTMAHGFRALGGVEVPNYTLLYLDNSKNKKKGDYQTIVVPYIEIGRSSSCVIQYDDTYTTIHGKHAAILWNKGQVTLKHLGTNPLFVNNYLVNVQQVLQNGDEIRFSKDGPRVRFNIASSKIGETRFTDRIVMFTQQALKPYKRGVAILSFLILSVLGFGINSRFQFNKVSNEYSKLLENQIEELEEKEERTKKIAAAKIALSQEIAILKKRNSSKKSQLRTLQGEMALMETQLEKIKRERSKIVIPPPKAGGNPEKVETANDEKITSKVNKQIEETSTSTTKGTESPEESITNNQEEVNSDTEKEDKINLDPALLIGKTVIYNDILKYKVNTGGGWLDLLVDIPVSFDIQYSGVIEQVLGENLKLIVSGASIKDPSWASMNYFEYKPYAVRDAQNQIGRTVVLDYKKVSILE